MLSLTPLLSRQSAQTRTNETAQADSVVPGTRFRFNCRIEPAGAKTRVTQTVEVGGPLGSVLGGMLGPQVSREFGTLLSNLARKAETT